MAIIVVGGSSRGVGKTALICGLIAALPELRWTAVKIAGHAHRQEPVWEETEAGQGTDTARFLFAGAKRALLVGAEKDFPMEEIRSALGKDTNAIFESNRNVESLRPDLCLAVVGGDSDVKSSFRSFVREADAIVMRSEIDWAPADLSGVPVFRIDDLGRIPPEMLAWLRERLVRSG
jgi:molybdopterin-guanine dinucleotide biosynthesis protein